MAGNHGNILTRKDRCIKGNVGNEFFNELKANVYEINQKFYEVRFFSSYFPVRNSYANECAVM